jgi:hypothetical protein
VKSLSRGLCVPKLTAIQPWLQVIPSWLHRLVMGTMVQQPDVQRQPCRRRHAAAGGAATLDFIRRKERSAYERVWYSEPIAAEEVAFESSVFLDPVIFDVLMSPTALRSGQPAVRSARHGPITGPMGPFFRNSPASFEVVVAIVCIRVGAASPRFAPDR